MALPQSEDIPPEDLVRLDLGEKRKAMRFALLIRSAKLVCSSGEFLCVIRDVSEDGVKLRLFHPLPENEPLLLVLGSGDHFPVELVWQDGDLAGFRFTNPIDLHRFISEASPYPKRPIRIRLSCPATLTIDGRMCAAEICDVSREGIRIETGVPLALEQKLILSADRLSPRAASVRWRRSPSYGLSLQNIFTFEELARTVARMQLPAEYFAAEGGERRA